MPRTRIPTLLAGALCAAYALLHGWWALVGAPAFLAPGESPLPGGWVPVAASGAAAVGLLLPDAGPRPLRVALAVVAGLGGAATTASCMLAWLDAVMLLMVPFGLPMTGAALATAAVRISGAAAGGLALGVAAARLRRLGVRPPPPRSARTPAWGWAAALLAVAGLAVRLVPELPRWAERGVSGPGGPGFVLFVALMLAAGTALPLALVLPAGRRLPRWLLLGPALVVGAGLVAYFGVGGVGAMVAGRLPVDAGAVAVIGGYTAWGAGLLGAAASYARCTARP